MQIAIARIVITLLLGFGIGYLVFEYYAPGHSRYMLHQSENGAIIHKIDTKTGQVWWKTSFNVFDSSGEEVTVWYWEELGLDRTGAQEIIENVKEVAEDVQQEETLKQQEAQQADLQTRQKRLNDIYVICGEDIDCVNIKCTDGYQGKPNPEWTAHCTETLESHINNVIIQQCRSDAKCIKTYCINKHNNTYPAVSKCVENLNNFRIKQNEATETKEVQAETEAAEEGNTE